jgi:hypothetical protein
MASLQSSKPDVPAKRTSLVRRGVAGLVLVAVVAIGLDILIHAILGIFIVLVVIAVAAAVLWAVKTIVW